MWNYVAYTWAALERALYLKYVHAFLMGDDTNTCRVTLMFPATSWLVSERKKKAAATKFCASALVLSPKIVTPTSS